MVMVSKNTTDKFRFYDFNSSDNLWTLLDKKIYIIDLMK